jgi:quinoprotein glucose dehydrogenase
LVSLFFFACHTKQANQWAAYLGENNRNHRVELNQITPSNVQNLKIAWTYSAPDSGQMQMNPIIVNGVLYGVTAAVQAFALDATTGKEIWRFGDPVRVWHSTSRGVAYWEDGNDRRILYTIGANLYALNAKTGKPIKSFGNKGKIDLHLGLPEEAKDKFIISNTPGTIFENLIILPTRVSEGQDSAPGDIRAFDVRTGKLAWSFHTIPYPGELGVDTWKSEAYKNLGIGGVNCWAGMTLDDKTGILYIPLGSAAPDFWGGNRLGNNLFSDCLLAVEAKTGKYVWHYQLIHHDMWDRDLPAPPSLIQVTQDGKTIDAVAQTTKQGYVFVFDRKTGKTLFPIQEVAAPASTLPGEVASATQPVPTLPKPFARQANELTENDLSPYAENKDELLKIFRQSDKRLFAPPSKEGVFLLPGYDGGAEWGGAAADPTEGILYVNSNEMAWILKMEENKFSTNGLPTGERIYNESCSVCHGKQRLGNPQSGYPSLVNLGQKRDKEYVSKLIVGGKGMMPGFPQLKPADKTALIQFLYGEEKKEYTESPNAPTYAPSLYKQTGYNKFLDSKGLPGIAPPWGTLSAINLNTGEYLWHIPFGETPSLKAKGFPTTGSENYGGAVVTANGLLFIGATKDGKFRAIDKKTGKTLWETQLPAAAFATPACYQVKGKQYIVIACGGEKLGTPKGNKIVAFSLE